MGIRKAAVAGQFYGGSRQECLEELAECLPKGNIKTQLPDQLFGGIVPHAGWMMGYL